MKNKCTIIQIDGFVGMLLLIFAVVCSVAGFVLFPAWCCQHGWNYIAANFESMPVMQLKHGAMLWLIIVLVAYATIFGKFKISFASVNEDFDGSADAFENIELIQHRKMNRDIVPDSKNEELKR